MKKAHNTKQNEEKKAPPPFICPACRNAGTPCASDSKAGTQHNPKSRGRAGGPARCREPPQNPVPPAAAWRSLPAAGQRAGPSLPPPSPKPRPTLNNRAAFLPNPGTSGDLRGERPRCLRACGRARMPGSRGDASWEGRGSGTLTTRGRFAAVSLRGEEKKKKKSYFLLRQSEGSHSPSHEKRRLAKIRGNWRHKPVCGDRGFKDPAALHRPPCPPLFPPSPHPHSAKKCCREGQATIPLPTCLLPLKKLPQRLWPPGINGQAAGAAMPPGAGRVRAQPSAVIRPGLRWRRAGARALTSRSTINLPSASPFSF